MKHEEVTIRTRDGQCPLHVFTPDGAGPWPAVIVYMDAFGIRPALLQVGERIAAGGYVALVPDLFYRYGAYGPLDPKEAFAGDFRAMVGPLMATTDNTKTAQDTEAFLAYLDTRGDVAGDKVGTVGFCMGGDHCGGNVSRSCGGDGELPRRTLGHRRSGQPALAGSEDPRGVVHRGRRQRSQLSAGNGRALQAGAG